MQLTALFSKFQYKKSHKRSFFADYRISGAPWARFIKNCRNATNFTLKKRLLWYSKIFSKFFITKTIKNTNFPEFFMYLGRLWRDSSKFAVWTEFFRILHQKSNFKDLQKAAIVCMVQPLCYLAYIVMVIVGQYFNALVNSVTATEVPLVFFKVYLGISRFYPIVNMICILIDAFLLLFVLRAYRTSMAMLLLKLLQVKDKMYSSNVVFISRTNT